ncbi:MAG TPA: phosphatidylinositol mannoside acyltransferase [Actinomycetes bacterium]|nr:phosphatidylinositol mannoside acyltransferase [Actinomycetes bacterium]
MSRLTGASPHKVAAGATYGLYAGAWALVRRLPEGAAYRLFELVADAVWRRQGRAVQRLEANLRRARPDLDPPALRRLSREGMRSYLRYWCDAFRLPDWDRDRVVSTVRVEGEQHLRRNVGEGGRGVVAALMHMGNWDHAGAWATLTGAPVVTVAERLRPERLFERFLAYRQGLGMEILPLTGGDGDLLDTLSQRLRSGRLVPLLADRDLRASGIDVELLGEATRMPPGPALLALRTGAALHPVSIWHEAGDDEDWPARLVIRFHDEVTAPPTGTTREKVTTMTQQVADVFGAAIREHPQDWHMLQPLWLADVPGRDGPLRDGPRP